jgi:hypothetical protein
MAAVKSIIKPIWEPPYDKSHFAIEKFRHHVNSSLGLKLGRISIFLSVFECLTLTLLLLENYDDIHEFSIQHANQFWLALWDFLDIKCSEKPLQISDLRP